MTPLRRLALSFTLVCAAAVTGCTQAPAGAEPVAAVAQAESPACTQSCPDGARIATFATTSSQVALDTFNGSFLYVSNGCETYCEPLTRCVAPNVPVVANGKFECQLLPKYTKLEDPASVDLSFGVLWDETQVTP